MQETTLFCGSGVVLTDVTTEIENIPREMWCAALQMLRGLNAISLSGRQTSDCSSPTSSASILVLCLNCLHLNCVCSNGILKADSGCVEPAEPRLGFQHSFHEVSRRIGRHTAVLCLVWSCKSVKQEASATQKKTNTIKRRENKLDQGANKAANTRFAPSSEKWSKYQLIKCYGDFIFLLLLL